MNFKLVSLLAIALVLLAIPIYAVEVTSFKEGDVVNHTFNNYESKTVFLEFPTNAHFTKAIFNITSYPTQQKEIIAKQNLSNEQIELSNSGYTIGQSFNFTNQTNITEVRFLLSRSYEANFQLGLVILSDVGGNANSSDVLYTSPTIRTQTDLETDSKMVGFTTDFIAEANRTYHFVVTANIQSGHFYAKTNPENTKDLDSYYTLNLTKTNKDSIFDLLGYINYYPNDLIVDILSDGVGDFTPESQFLSSRRITDFSEMLTKYTENCNDTICLAPINITSINGTISLSELHLEFNYTPIINQIGFEENYTFGTETKGSANVTDYDSKILDVMFRIIAPDGTEYSNTNGTAIGTIWKSESLVIDQYGDWKLIVTAKDSQGYSVTKREIISIPDTRLNEELKLEELESVILGEDFTLETSWIAENLIWLILIGVVLVVLAVWYYKRTTRGYY